MSFGLYLTDPTYHATVRTLVVMAYKKGVFRRGVYGNQDLTQAVYYIALDYWVHGVAYLHHYSDESLLLLEPPYIRDEGEDFVYTREAPPTKWYRAPKERFFILRREGGPLVLEGELSMERFQEEVDTFLELAERILGDGRFHVRWGQKRSSSGDDLLPPSRRMV